MKTKLLFSALVAISTMGMWAQAQIVNFPQELGNAEYGKVGGVPSELKDATGVQYKTEVDGNIIAEYYVGTYRLPHICSFDADMNMYFFSEKSSRYIGINEAKQVVIAKSGKNGTDICLLDKKMNLVRSTSIPYADFFIKADYMSVKDGKIYLILWLKESKKVTHYMGYVLDANTLNILSQTELGTSYSTQFIFSDNKEYIGSVAVDETKGKYLRHPLYNGANIRLMDKKFNLIQERYIYGNIDDPWVWAQDEKTRNKIYNGGMAGVLTNGDYHIQVNNDGVLKYITLDAASAHKITASSNEIIPIRNNRLSVYTLSVNRNDSVSISNVIENKILMRQTLIKADENNIILQAWYKNLKSQFASAGYISINWNLKTNELVTLKDVKNSIFPAGVYDDSKNIIYKDGNGVLVEHIRGKQGAIFYDMWCSMDGKEILFPMFSSPAVNDDTWAFNNFFFTKPITYRTLVTHSNTTDVFCFLVHEALNSGFNANTPIETTKPVYLEFINKNRKLAEYVFPETTYETVSFGVLGGKKAYKSLLIVNASSIDDNSIRLYIQHTKDKKHQWVTLFPNVFNKEYKENNPDKF